MLLIVNLVLTVLVCMSSRLIYTFLVWFHVNSIPQIDDKSSLVKYLLTYMENSKTTMLTREMKDYCKHVKRFKVFRSL